MRLSLIVPCYNEVGNVRAFYDAAKAVFAPEPYECEFVFVDDGSADGTFGELQKLVALHELPVKVVSFSRNFGKESAIYAGLQASRGDYVTLIDADLQQRPEVAKQMMDMLLADPQLDCVAACQETRHEGGLTAFLKHGFYRTIDRLADVRFHENASDFRTFNRKMADTILSMGEYQRFSKGIFAWIGFRVEYIPYEAQARVSGASKWSMKKLFKYAFDGILSFSTAPLRAVTVCGGLSAFAAFVYLIVMIVQKLTSGIDVPGYATIVVLLLFLGGLQLLGLGIIGEYVGKIFMECKKRPIYIARTVLDSEAENGKVQGSL
jgi:glycosyltransferase involved in cell wall biosynthesis